MNNLKVENLYALVKNQKNRFPDDKIILHMTL